MNPGKRLVVNADDLGRTAGVNEGILAAHRNGIVTSASLMVNFPAAGQAPDLAREAPALGVGLHLAFTGGRPALPPHQIPSLVDAEGRLPARPAGLQTAHPEHVMAEARAQLKRFRKLMGRDPTHFDTHHHAHRLPAVMEVLVTLAWETGLPVRNASPEGGRRLRRENIATTDHFVERFHGEGATLEGLLDIVHEVAAGSTELMCHPARVDDELRAGSSYAEPRARELEALVNREVRQAVQAMGILLIHFGELARQ